MSPKNHIARIMTVLLIITVMVSMAGVEGTFEIKINTVQHSTPINGEVTTGNSPPVTTIPVTPVITLTTPVTSGPVVTPAESTPQERANSTIDGIGVNTPVQGQDDFWSFVNSMFDSAPGESIPTTVPTTIATPVPTPVPTTVPTRIPTKVPTTLATTIPTPVPTTLPMTATTTEALPNREIRGNGTISLVTTDSDFWGIVSDDGSHFVPGKIDPMFQVDGLRVTYRVLERHDRDDPHNWGVPVDLLELVQVGRVIEQRIDGKGTIHYEDLEGGFYGIIADNGERYIPINLDDTFKTGGLRVKFSAYPASIATSSMWGTPVRLVKIDVPVEQDASHIIMTGYTRWISSSSGSGTFGIIGDDGTLYIPSELDESFKQNGLYVQFTAEEIRNDAMISRNRIMLVRLLDIALYSK
jgi:hypothetical protein